LTQSSLKKEVGIFGLSSNIINTVIGAGIFVLPALVAEGLGSTAVSAYLFCGFLISMIMLCFAEVGSKISHPGGPYAYIEVAFGKYVGFIAALLFIISGIVSDAAVSNAFFNILSSLFPIIDTPTIRILFLFGIFSLLAFVNVRGTKQGLSLVKLMTLMKTGPLILLVILGLGYMDLSNLKWDHIPGVWEVGEVSLVLFFAFLGAETGLTINGEVANPKRTIPRSIFLSIAIILILYIGIQTVAQGVLGADLANFKDSPLSQVASVIFGPIGFTLMGIGAAVSMFGNLSSEILSVPRVVQSAAQDGVLPSKWLAKINSKYATPSNAIILYSFLGLLIATVGGFKQLAILVSAVVLLLYLGVALAVIKLRQSHPFEKGQFKIPGGMTVPIITTLIIFYFLSSLTMNEIIGISIMIVLLSILYFILKKLDVFKI
jgi:APA family basic amino acid/polyamine antiporter